MIKLKYQDTYLDVLNGYDITKSSQDVQFSDLTCDFTGYRFEDLPEKYQEVKLINISNIGYEKIIYTGYVDDIDFDEMRELDVDTTINISLLSPLTLSTLRTTIAIGNYQLKGLIEKIILLPLLEDGFILEEIDITDKTTTVNFLCETVEYCMNDLSNKFNFWWFIDENKKIYIKDITKMFKDNPNHIYDDIHIINGLEYIKPIISSGNYANVINFKNVRVYHYSRLIFEDNNIKEEHNSLISKQINQMEKNKSLEFKYPVDITQKNIIKSAISNGITGDAYGLYISGVYSDNSTFELYIKTDYNGLNYEMSSNIGFDGDTDSTADFLLTRDAFFSNLITGFKYNNDNKKIKVITQIKSDSALIWNINKVYNDKAIENKRGKISDTGIVELTIDMRESWKTVQELRDIAISYMNKNSIEYDGEIEIGLDNLNNMRVGNSIYINKMLINSIYIITKIRAIYRNNDEEYIVTCKNANLLDNFIDIFRGEDTQISANKAFEIYITHYLEEALKEIHEVVR